MMQVVSETGADTSSSTTVAGSDNPSRWQGPVRAAVCRSTSRRCRVRGYHDGLDLTSKKKPSWWRPERRPWRVLQLEVGALPLALEVARAAGLAG